MKITHKEMLLEILKKHNKCEVIVGGTSMWPFIKDGDIVAINKTSFNPSPGMVVAFFAGEQLIIHRIIWCREKNSDKWDILVHGDACPFSISKIKTDQIIGVIKYVKRENRKVSLSFDDLYRIISIPIGFALQLLILLKFSICRKNGVYKESV